jgi:hypothetical protein
MKFKVSYYDHDSDNDVYSALARHGYDAKK